MAHVKNSLFITAVLTVLACLGSACGDDDPTASDHQRGAKGLDGGVATRDGGEANAGGVERSKSKFRSVTVDDSGQKASDGGIGVSLRRRTVRAPGVLVLEDELGNEQMNVEDTDYTAVLDIVLDPTFSAAVQNPDDCHFVPDDVAGGIEIVWSDIGPLTDPAAQSCLIGRSNHPYNRLLWLLIDLQKKYLPCRLLPAYDSRARPLCAGCWGWFPPDDC